MQTRWRAARQGVVGRLRPWSQLPGHLRPLTRMGRPSVTSLALRTHAVPPGSVTAAVVKARSRKAVQHRIGAILALSIVASELPAQRSHAAAMQHILDAWGCHPGPGPRPPRV
jgi:hypothetical protein